MHTWSWLYTVLAFVFLLVVFVICGLVLLLRRPFRRRWHETRGSISTPYGYLPIWDKQTQHMLAPGVRRARKRNYVNPRGER